MGLAAAAWHGVLCIGWLEHRAGLIGMGGLSVSNRDIAYVRDYARFFGTMICFVDDVVSMVFTMLDSASLHRHPTV